MDQVNKKQFVEEEHKKFEELKVKIDNATKDFMRSSGRTKFTNDETKELITLFGTIRFNITVTI